MGGLGAGCELPFQGVERAAGPGGAGVEEFLSVEVLREFGHSEGGDGVEDRTGGARDSSRGGGDEEVPAAAFGGFPGDLFQVAVVEDGHAHGNQYEFVDGLRDAFDAGGENVFGGIASEDGHVTGAEPFGTGDVEAGESLADGPWAFGVAAGEPAGADEDDVAGTYFKVGLFFPGVEIFGVDAGAGFEVIDSFEPGDVHQNSSCDDAVAEVEDTVLCGSVLGDFVFGKAVVHFAVVQEVTEGVHVGVDVAVIGDEEGVAGVGGAGGGFAYADAGHFADDGLGVIDGGLEFGEAGEGEGDAFFDGGEGLFAFGGGDEVDGAHLIVLAPTAPVGEVFHVLIEVGSGGIVAGGGLGGAEEGGSEKHLELLKSHGGNSINSCPPVFVPFAPNVGFDKLFGGAWTDRMSDIPSRSLLVSVALVPVSALRSAAAVSVFSPGQKRRLKAFANRLVPHENGPGVECGAVEYIERSLGDPQVSGKLAVAGLEAVDALARQTYGAALAELAADQQDAVVSAVEGGAGAAGFFAMIRRMVLEGMFCDAVRGGNRSYAGWDLIRFPGPRLAVARRISRLEW